MLVYHSTKAEHEEPRVGNDVSRIDCEQNMTRVPSLTQRVQGDNPGSWVSRRSWRRHCGRKRSLPPLMEAVVEKANLELWHEVIRTFSVAFYASSCG